MSSEEKIEEVFGMPNGSILRAISVASTSKIKIIDDRTFSYDGVLIAVHLLDSLVNPVYIPSAWMRVVKKEDKTVTIESTGRQFPEEKP